MWLQDVLNRIPSSVKLVLFKTSNRVCAKEKFNDILLDGYYAYNDKSNGTKYEQTIQECYETIQNNIIHQSSEATKVAFQNITKEEIVEYCQHGTFDDHGMYLSCLVVWWIYPVRLPSIRSHTIYPFAFASFLRVFVHVGAQYLNQRIHNFVEKYNAQHDCGNGPIIQIFNDHDVESCDYTTHTDGRHSYHYLNMLRIRLFMNQLQCVQNGANWK
jgi:hypothetical protein